MRTAILLLITTMLFGGLSERAGAQDEAALSEACHKASQFVAQYEGGTIESAQSFPELTPPRVQILIEYEDLMFPRLVRCTFESNRPPFGITQYCTNGDCDLSAERFEELQVLMQRAGY